MRSQKHRNKDRDTIQIQLKLTQSSLSVIIINFSVISRINRGWSEKGGGVVGYTGQVSEHLTFPELYIISS